jgi:protein-S-isoprenylcysteine O-methyltransferase Ste14
VLVALQFGLMGAQAWVALASVLSCAMAPAAWLAGAMCLLLAAWAMSANRPGNFNIRPIPKAGGALVTHGPYRWVRHPMYTAVLLGAFALARTADSGAAWLVWAALALVLWVKSTLEERWLQEQHPGYVAYMRRTHRFIPGLL